MRHAQTPFLLALSACLALSAGRLAAQEPAKSTQAEPGSSDPKLSLELDIHARDLLISDAEPGSQFLVWAGGTAKTAGGLLEPAFVVASSFVDIHGNASVPIDLQYPELAGQSIRFQAAAAQFDAKGGLKDLRISKIVSATFRKATAPSSAEPREQLEIVHDIESFKPEARLLARDGRYGRVLVEVSMTAPTTGYCLQVKGVRWDGDHAQVDLRVVKPSGVTATVRTPLRELVDLSSRVDTVRVVIE